MKKLYSIAQAGLLSLFLGCTPVKDQDFQTWDTPIKETAALRAKDPHFLEELEKKVFDLSTTTNSLAVGKQFPAYKKTNLGDFVDLFRTCAFNAQSAMYISSSLDLAISPDINPIDLIKNSTDTLLAKSEYQEYLLKDLKYPDLKCQAYASTSAGIAINLIRNSTNAPQTLEIISGIAYHSTGAPRGTGHIWVKADDTIIDQAIQVGEARYVPLVGVAFKYRRNETNSAQSRFMLLPRLYCIPPEIMKEVKK